ncbi:uncharacterized protein CCOS01_13968 [Colletotrichum costaricense]|uniref:Uncharacterized protein n=1 Tax=Colletotrichum costaricense TaxID=1209916 RepID=A0AAI9YKL4_9PEZI|nr:uncharacterized protein CCOS01_13968 [Colletotrichum costaricense]KAK1514028.1 hypothetical protein CCOS01_13968 [Colletotrichum costaricense]
MKDVRRAGFSLPNTKDPSSRCPRSAICPSKPERRLKAWHGEDGVPSFRVGRWEDQGQLGAATQGPAPTSRIPLSGTIHHQFGALMSDTSTDSVLGGDENKSREQERGLCLRHPIRSGLTRANLEGSVAPREKEAPTDTDSDGRQDDGVLNRVRTSYGHK